MKKFIIAVAACAMFAMATPVVSMASTSSAAATSMAQGTNIDKLLDDYEKAFKEYAAAIKSQDMTKIMAASAKFNSLQQKLYEVADDMTEAQVLRLSKIAAKAADLL